MKRKIIGRGACKHPRGRGEPSREFTIDGIGYYFCYGWFDGWGELLAPECEKCPAHIDAADDVLDQIKKEKEEERKCRS